jgi:hypothetical protein
VPLLEEFSGQDEGAFVTLSASLVEKPGSAFCVHAYDDYLSPVIRRGDVMVVDGSVTDMDKLYSELVVIRWVPEGNLERSEKNIKRYAEHSAQDEEAVRSRHDDRHHPFRVPGFHAGWLRRYGRGSGFSAISLERPVVEGIQSKDQGKLVIGNQYSAELHPERGGRVELFDGMRIVGRVTGWLRSPKRPRK